MSLKRGQQHLHPQAVRPQIISEAPGACSLLGVLRHFIHLSASPVSCLETGVERCFLQSVTAHRVRYSHPSHSLEKTRSLGSTFKER